MYMLVLEDKQYCWQLLITHCLCSKQGFSGGSILLPGHEHLKQSVM